MPSVQELLSTNANRLVAINIAVFIVLQAIFAGQLSGFELYAWQNPDFQFWQLFSYMFLHANFTHLLLNMFGLWMFGRFVERVIGARRFLIFFLVCGVGAALVHLAYSEYQFQSVVAQLQSAGFSPGQIESVYLQGRDISTQSSAIDRAALQDLYSAFNAPAVGASGALYGILVAFAFMFPEFKVMLIFLPVPVAAKYFVPALLVLDLVAGLGGFPILGHNIAHFAHLGGALAGFLLVQYWLRNNSP